MAPSGVVTTGRSNKLCCSFTFQTLVRARANCVERHSHTRTSGAECVLSRGPGLEAGAELPTPTGHSALPPRASRCNQISQNIRVTRALCRVGTFFARLQNKRIQIQVVTVREGSAPAEVVFPVVLEAQGNGLFVRPLHPHPGCGNVPDVVRLDLAGPAAWHRTRLSADPCQMTRVRLYRPLGDRLACLAGHGFIAKQLGQVTACHKYAQVARRMSIARGLGKQSAETAPSPRIFAPLWQRRGFLGLGRVALIPVRSARTGRHSKRRAGTARPHSRR